MVHRHPGHSIVWDAAIGNLNVLINFYCYDRYSEEKGKGLFSLQLQDHDFKEVKAETRASDDIIATVKSKERINTPLLACSQLDFIPLTPSRTPCLGNGAAHNGLGPPTSSNNQENPQTDMPTGLPNIICN